MDSIVAIFLSYQSHEKCNMSGIQDVTLLRKILCNCGIKGMFRGSASLVVADLKCLKFTVPVSHVVSDSLPPHELQHARPPCPSPPPGVHSDSRPSSRRCHPAISFLVVLFSSCPQSLPASESFPVSQHFAWGGQSTGVSALASFLLRNPRVDLLQNGLVGSPCSPRDSQESSPTPQFKSINSSVLSFLHSPTNIHTWPLEKP